MPNIITNEVIAFQANSTLGKCLVEVFDEVLNYKKSLRKGNENETDSKQESKKRIYKVNKFFKDVTTSKLIKIIFEETNISISKFFYNDTESVILNASVSVRNYLKDFDHPNKVLDIGVGVQKEDRLENILENLKELSDDLNRKTGKLKTVNTKKNIFVEMFFDNNGFLNIDEYLKNNVVKPFTAEELTSVILHELGHVIAHYELAEKTQKTIREFDEFITTINKNKDIDTLIKDLKIVKNEFAKIDTFPDDKKKIIVNSLTNLETTYNCLMGSSSSLVTTGIRHVLLIPLFSIILIIFYKLILCLFFYKIFLSGYFKDMEQLRLINKTNHKVRSGELRSTKYDFLMVERLADEYVARHGFSGSNATCEQKMEICISFLDGISEEIRMVGLNYFQILFSNIVSQYFKREENNILYDQHAIHILRMQDSLIDTIKIFKNPQLPKDLRDHYIEQCNMIQAVLSAAINKQKKSTVANVFFNKIIPLINGSKLLEILTTEQIDKEYLDLLRTFEKLTTNELFLQSAKLDQFVDKLKS